MTKTKHIRINQKRSLLSGLKILTHKNLIKTKIIIKYFFDLFKTDRIVVFHHLPKCGGSSVLSNLSNWFIVINDYFIWPNKHNITLKDYYNKPINLNNLHNINCLSGHYCGQDVTLFQRYPSMYENRKYFIFTFVREPLATKISLYYYILKLYGKEKFNIPLEEYILTEPNYISRNLGVNLENIDNILERYDFIGTIENDQESLDILAKKLNRQKRKMIRINTTKKDSQIESISDNLKKEFEKINYLDYKIYNYALTSNLNQKFYNDNIRG